jgi:hypothetical protein
LALRESGGELLEEFMRPDRRLERRPDRESGQKDLRKGDPPGPVAGRSSMTKHAFSTLRSVSRNTGATWAAATL